MEEEKKFLKVGGSAPGSVRRKEKNVDPGGGDGFQVAQEKKKTKGGGAASFGSVAEEEEEGGSNVKNKFKTRGRACLAFGWRMIGGTQRKKIQEKTGVP